MRLCLRAMVPPRRIGRPPASAAIEGTARSSNTQRLLVKPLARALKGISGHPSRSHHPDSHDHLLPNDLYDHRQKQTPRWSPCPPNARRYTLREGSELQDTPQRRHRRSSPQPVSGQRARVPLAAVAAEPGFQAHLEPEPRLPERHRSAPALHQEVRHNTWIGKICAMSTTERTWRGWELCQQVAPKRLHQVVVLSLLRRGTLPKKPPVPRQRRIGLADSPPVPASGWTAEAFDLPSPAGISQK
mmetsp:Transcript_11549/g.26847  ORF Transcript_11549/g.26847 Transcript_11549/m.26847 type:complete len:244 (+) Transcript_11549:130-861(+)